MNRCPARGSSIYLASEKKLLAVVINNTSPFGPPIQGHVVCLTGTAIVIVAVAVTTAGGMLEFCARTGLQQLASGVNVDSSYLLTVPPSYSAFHKPWLRKTLG